SSDCWRIIHLPEKPPVLPHLQPTVDVLACAVEPQYANTIVRSLNHIAPLEGLRHVKRIRKTLLDGGQYRLCVILCVDYGRNGESGCVPEELNELVKTYQLNVFNAKVHEFAATTKEEWQEQCKLWPTSFHPPTYDTEGITGFTDEESESIFNFMRIAVGLAKSGSQHVNAAVIVDPSTSQMISRARDEVYSSEPVETVAECGTLRDGDHPKLLSKCLFREEKPACLDPYGWPHLGSDSCHPLRHAAIAAIEKSASRDRRLFPSEDSGVGSPLKKQKIDGNTKGDDDLQLGNKTRPPYLCTGYDIFFAWEPCIMCAMAIVHQRIRRVFFAFPNLEHGALGSVYRLQGERSLNHHYAVFRVLIP
ncbi:hypothetical protein M569_03397, partial [Genlisea aurea]